MFPDPTPTAEVPNPLEAALRYTARGWAVFPCYEPSADGCSCARGAACGSPGKHPRTPNGCSDATTDTETIRAWWSRWPSANVAIATGAASGVDVVDVDAKSDGASHLAKLESAHGPIPTTLRALTGSGGFHIFLTASGLATKAASLAPGIDTRGDGGYVIAPPSLHRSGERYRWVDETATVAGAPDWVRAAAQVRLRPPPLEPSDWASPTADGIDEEVIRARLLSPARPEHHRAASQRMLAGAELFPSGAHHDSLWSFLSHLRFTLPEVTDATILRLLRPSVEEMQRRGNEGRGCEHDLGHVARELRRVNSEFGRRQAASARDAGLLAALVKAKPPSPDPTSTVGRDDTWRAPPGYSITSTGGPDSTPGTIALFKLGEGGKPMPIASAPINIIETGEDEQGTLYVTTKWLHGERVVTETLPRLKVYSPDLLELAARGAPVTSGNRQKVQDFLQAQEQRFHAALPSVRIFTRSGWSTDLRSFVLGREVLGGSGRVIMPAETSFLDALTSAGSADEHLRLTLAVRDQGPIAEMAWAVGYAAPLLRLLELRSLCLSIWGSSGTGKSAVQATATSVWGRPSALKVNGDVSPAALQGELARHRDLPMWVDDTQLDRRGMGDVLAYIVGSEASGARATQNGDLRARKVWRSIAFVSGEKSLLQIGGAAGAKNRTLEVRAQPLRDPLLAQRTHRGLERHHGHTGRKFVQRLIDEIAADGGGHELRDLHRKLGEAIAPASTQQVRDVAALVLGDLLARVWICGESYEPAERAAINAGREFYADVTKAAEETESTADVAYAAINAFVAGNLDAFSQSGGAGGRRFGAIQKKVEEAGGRDVAVILPNDFIALAKATGFDARQVFSELVDRKLAIRGEGRHLARYATVGGRRVRGYAVVLEGPPEEFRSSPARDDARRLP